MTQLTLTTAENVDSQSSYCEIQAEGFLKVIFCVV